MTICYFNFKVLENSEFGDDTNCISNFKEGSIFELAVCSLKEICHPLSMNIINVVSVWGWIAKIWVGSLSFGIFIMGAARAAFLSSGTKDDDNVPCKLYACISTVSFLLITL